MVSAFLFDSRCIPRINVKRKELLKMTVFFSQLINGLSLGSIYALIALGYSMVYGIILGPRTGHRGLCLHHHLYFAGCGD